ncbi:MAG: hypothetical protein QTN59_20310 [Candidatus Electrothrix communis]|nr:MAG: hypothetical protein QTN59_20310 [Candidatus Electrothrix communis]
MHLYSVNPNNNRRSDIYKQTSSEAEERKISVAKRSAKATAPSMGCLVSASSAHKMAGVAQLLNKTTRRNSGISTILPHSFPLPVKNP